MTLTSTTVRQVNGKGRSTDWVSPVIGLILVAALLYGWTHRTELPWESEVGTGYWLGIAGVSLVGLLLIYPLRKRLRFLGVIGTVPVWFRLHMFAGAFAPVLILYHSRFQLGSINANVALYCMLVVGGSGVIGRYLYVRIHRGIAGRRKEARQMIAQADALLDELSDGLREAVRIAQDLEDSLAVRSSGFFSAIFRAVRESWRINAARREMLAVVRAEPNATPRQRKQSRRLIRQYCETLRSAIQLEIFERFFALWHVVHLPLFFLMVLAVIVHIVAVHLY